VDQLLTRYLDQFDGAPNTLTNYRGYLRNHISPLIGQMKVSALDAGLLNSFYAELRRCRQHCSGRRSKQHWTRQPHECDQRCARPHVCRALGALATRHIHFAIRSVRASCPLALGRYQPCESGHAAGCAEAESSAVVTA
jgi:integrase